MFNWRTATWVGVFCVVAGAWAAPVKGKAGAENGSDALAELVKVLDESDDPSFHVDILKGMSEALKGRRGVKMPAGWARVSEKLAKSPNEEVRNLVRGLSTQFGDEASLERARKTVLDKAAAAEERGKALAALLETKPKDFAPLLQGLLGDPALRGAAVRGLGLYDDAKTPRAVLAHYKEFSAAEKLDALNTLAGREAYALELLKAIDSKAVARTELTAAVVRTLGELKNEAVDKWIAANWGAVRSSPEEKLKEMAEIRALVTAAKAEEVSASRGRAVYARTCQQCHTLFGDGGKVGPDLTGSGRADLEYVLSNVVDPNAVVGKDYQMWVIRTKDRQQLAGLIGKEDEHTVTIVTENQTTVLPRKEIARMKQSDVSMMPEGLLAGLPKDELLDLIAYIRSPQQVPMAATQPATQPSAPLSPLAAAAEEANRLNSRANLREIGQALITYTFDHGGEFPADLAALKAYIKQDKVFLNPRDPDRREGYVYVRPPEGRFGKVRNAAQRLVTYEAHDQWKDGVAAGFVDGHVEWVGDKAKFDELLKAARKPPEAQKP